ncbi:hypothetical protein AB0D11_43900 [Streptomyces monashensis]|uniref:hypothetical protein n=1 Tax=Streptomyces monashensis TaxID=1678012 RepID=UPI0033E00EDA
MTLPRRTSRPTRPQQYTSHVYATADPAAPARAADAVRTVLATWQTPEATIEQLAELARILVAEAATDTTAPVLTVITAQDQPRAAVHVVSTTCSQDHPADLVDPDTAEALHALNSRHGGRTRQPGCLCTTLAWHRDRRPFITTPASTPRRPTPPSQTCGPASSSLTAPGREERALVTQSSPQPGS